MERRNFIKYLSGSIAAIAAGCRRPEQKIISAVRPDQAVVPGEVTYYNSVYCVGNVPYGITVKTYNGRPIKIDGNLEYPLNLGGSTPEMQASIYSLYDPKRFWKPRVNGKETDLETALRAARVKVDNTIKNGGKIFILIDEHCSPSFNQLIEEIENKNKNVKFYYLPTDKYAINRINSFESTFGYQAELVPDLSKADYILCIGSDPLGNDKLSLYHTTQISNRKKDKSRKPLKIVSIEDFPTLTGKSADQILKLDNTNYNFTDICRYLSFKLNEKFKFLKHDDFSTFETQNFNNEIEKFKKGFDSKELVNIVNELISNGDKSCILENKFDIFTFRNEINYYNYLLGNYGNNKIFNPNNYTYNSNLLKTRMFDFSNEEILNDSKSLFLFLDVNSEDIIDSEYFNKIQANRKLLLNYKHISKFTDYFCNIPTNHYLENWSDSLSFNDIYSIQQPVISPLNKNSIDNQNFLIKMFLNNDEQDFYGFIRNNYNIDIEEWEKLLKKGYNIRALKGNIGIKLQTNSIPSKLYLNPGFIDYPAHTIKDILLYTKTNINDSNGNPFLEELPDTVLGLSLGNVIIINKKIAMVYKLRNGDFIKLYNFSKNDSVEGPIIISNNLKDDPIYFYNMDNSCSYSYFYDYIEKTGKHIDLAITNPSIRIELNSNQSLDNFDDILKVIHNKSPKPVANQSILPGYKYLGNKWAMAIDQELCTGCQACVIACQIENNIPVVGKEEAKKGRLMHWIKINRYEISKDGKTEYINEPMLCQHCNIAPCESVCPVGATTHSPEGINDMTYNRCIGARFCMANCPYEVRRFNFADYSERIKAPLELLSNPDVTVRSRGVAEKCTFCVQRINEARYKAKANGINKFDEDVKTACQQACPAGAITFGNINNKNSEVYKLSQSKRAYKILDELGTHTSVFYLMKEKYVK